MSLEAILDSYDGDYPERFLDEAGDLRGDVAMDLAVRLAGVLAGRVSLWQLAEGCEEWTALAVALMDGYELEALEALWFDGGATAELEDEPEWPGPAVYAFLEGAVHGGALGL